MSLISHFLSQLIRRETDAVASISKKSELTDKPGVIVDVYSFDSES